MELLNREAMKGKRKPRDTEAAQIRRFMQGVLKPKLLIFRTAYIMLLCVFGGLTAWCSRLFESTVSHVTAFSVFILACAALCALLAGVLCFKEIEHAIIFRKLTAKTVSGDYEVCPMRVSSAAYDENYGKDRVLFSGKAVNRWIAKSYMPPNMAVFDEDALMAEFHIAQLSHDTMYLIPFTDTMLREQPQKIRRYALRRNFPDVFRAHLEK